jgi:ribosomal protein S18 acetylase RimI-like enzyme
MKNSILFRAAIAADAKLISNLANTIWWHAYTPILSEEQIRFMLKEIYNPETISAQINAGIHFTIAEKNKNAIGFTSFKPKENESSIYRIEKLYLLPETHGMGIGKKLLKHVEEIAKKKAFTTLELNVNRNNPALEFYKKEGFTIIKEVDIPYYHFVLNDYIMQKSI